MVNPSERLGNLAGGSQEVKSHLWFKDVDWDALYHRRFKGPIIPFLRGAADASNFDEYDDEPDRKSFYTKQMEDTYEDVFRNF